MIIESDFLRHWKTRHLASLLGDDGKAPLYVLAIWLHLYDRRSDRVRAVPEVLTSIAGYEGPLAPGEFLKALCDCDYFERDGKMLVAHEFRERHAKAFANWENGARGGRPRKEDGTFAEGREKGLPETQLETHKKPTRKPSGNPQETQWKPEGKEGREGREEREDTEAKSEVCPHKEMQQYWNELSEESGLRKSRVWPDDMARPRWTDDWFRETWRDIFQEAHRNRWCRENRIGPEHVLRLANARRYYEEALARKEQKGGAAAGKIRCMVRHQDGTVSVRTFASLEEGTRKLKEEGYVPQGGARDQFIRNEEVVK